MINVINNMVFSDAMGIWEGGISFAVGTLTLTDDELLFDGKNVTLRVLKTSGNKFVIKLKDISKVKKDKKRSWSSFGLGVPCITVFVKEGEIEKEYSFTNKLKTLRISRTHSLDEWIEEIQKHLK